MDLSDWISGYAAGVATLVAVRQLALELPRVIVQYGEMTIFTPGTEREDPAHVLTVTNSGRRPIKITSAGFITKDLVTNLPTDWLLQRHTAVPFTLGESEYRILHLVKSEQQQPVPEGVRWYVVDSIGRMWPRRTRYWYRLRRLPRRLRRVFRREA